MFHQMIEVSSINYNIIFAVIKIFLYGILDNYFVGAALCPITINSGVATISDCQLAEN